MRAIIGIPHLSQIGTATSFVSRSLSDSSMSFVTRHAMQVAVIKISLTFCGLRVAVMSAPRPKRFVTEERYADQNEDSNDYLCRPRK